MPGLSQVRRLEAVGFRSWPAANTYFDGAWAIRLTAGHPSKRLNSVNPLDPSDHADLDGRIKRAELRFRAFGRPLVFRQSPLASPELDNMFDAQGWRRFDETIVFRVDMDKVDLEDVIDRVPIRDSGRWVDDIIAMKGVSLALKPGLSELIGNIRTSVGLFATEDPSGTPLSTAMCVHDNDLAGLFEIITHPDHRRQGLGRAIIKSALLWAKNHGAKRAWLQVVSANEPAIDLYLSLGFREIYRYAYRQAPESWSSNQ